MQTCILEKVFDVTKWPTPIINNGTKKTQSPPENSSLKKQKLKS